MHPTRDFSFVDDTVSGFLATLDSEKSIGEEINVGSNFEISIGETLDVIAKTIGVAADVVTDEQRQRPAASEVERLWCDNTKAEQLLGWTPDHGGLDGFRRGIEKTVAWFADPDNLGQYKSDRYNI